MFKMNEIVVGQNFISKAHRNGQECEIIGELRLRESSNSTTGEITTKNRYRVKWANGDITTQEPHFLRKKKPPEASWEEIQKSIGWNPTIPDKVSV